MLRTDRICRQVQPARVNFQASFGPNLCGKLFSERFLYRSKNLFDFLDTTGKSNLR